MAFFEGFKLETVDTGRVTIRLRRGGVGPPLLLLHGNPQTHAMWHKVAPALARHFTVIAADLHRLWRELASPRPMPTHTPYSKRAMAQDQVAMMAKLGFDRFLLAGHDRGGRVAYRLALDHPDKVLKLATLDILPTYEHFRRTNMDFAMGYWHWFFLAQPYDLPEKLIGADPEVSGIGTRRANRSRRASSRPKRWRIICAAAATPRRSTRSARITAPAPRSTCASTKRIYGRKKIACPLLALWGDKGKVGQWYDVLAVWRDWAVDVRGRAMPSGHYIPEEAPEETLAEFLAFFGDGAKR